ncbi:asparagine synthetase [Coemansia sp. RSA 2706]|nr:asparagine synthetase [Coemansia sp. RSA 2711]KAJ2299384.1 asparagine synthetase [Coemansia sp. RSA 2706]KAJ2311051.1 asparagine synthetase [Coemansia sp. RSA 2705]KAJ2318542.1 asparagine synthetase [Coemansia sp. RSA 2704]KAJ2327502.1 asparagine synthetase [Coemansia sp. RSA 2702]KAJ2365877.1 asparagine synthetase [Coemansia sp. RSA 2610]KAJ2388483.1 asparagine synthetase [Coemansia sp. RSA 2611]KAJ2734718.1 asparagine synthetase [Coemansia sp. Cherry 401B]
MCGIFGVYNYYGDVNEFRQRALDLSKRVRHRGPDWSGCVVAGNSIMCHERLAIVGIDTGAQPLTDADEKIILTVNGEIYNHKQLEQQLQKPAQFKTHSDCEVILHMYKEIGTDVCAKLDGMFSWALLDTRDASQPRLVVARDPIGITTLYIGRVSAHPETVFFASELKSLNEECDVIEEFPPGHFFDSQTGKFTRYFQPNWWDASRIATTPVDYRVLREALVAAVRKRLMAEVPYGVLLSGGLDSSLISSIAVREAARISAAAHSDAEDIDTRGARYYPRMHSFSVGLPGAPDLLAARKVAKFLKTAHHEFTYTIQEGLDAVADVIYHLETYDVTTIRASTPMYLMSRKIKATGVKMVLSGEGSDEVFGGYLYFHYAPTADEFHQETVKRVHNLHTSDCLRANKSTMAWGLEARVPFLDKEFLQVAMNVRAEDKLCSKDVMEKAIIRRAFDVDFADAGFTAEELKQGPYLPRDVLWRQKEQFSDGVGYSWIDSLKDWAASRVSDESMAQAKQRFPHDTPDTKEAYLYREIFEQRFPQPACLQSVVRWVPRTDWGCSADPSGRAQKIHEQAY